MNRYGLFLLLFFPLLVACTPKLQVTQEQVQTPVVNRLKAAKQSLQSKHTSRQEIPSVLGGIVQSDNWTVYRDKQQEEFSGHVFYDNGTYTFKSDYALSERAYNRLTAKGNVYLKQKEPNGTTYEAYAHTARYNYKTQQGTLQARNSSTPVKLIYTPTKDQPVTATAQKVTFDLDKRIFTLEGKVHVERNTPQGLQTLSARKAYLKQTEDYIKLEGNAILSDSLRSLEAETIIYDGAHNESYASGERPLLHGSTEQGTFAIIADKVSSDAEGNKVILDGQVQGWFVSPQINQVDFSKFNQGFSYGTAQ